MTDDDRIRAETLLAFWREAGPDRWFEADPDFDAACGERFLPDYRRAARDELCGWEEEPDGALALVLLLDQIPRNVFRRTARAWATDDGALDIARRAIRRGFDTSVDPTLRRFLYLPFSHSEDIDVQDEGVALTEAAGDADALRWARHHRAIVARFGRFPHRNDPLGRSSTSEELTFLVENPFGT